MHVRVFGLYIVLRKFRSSWIVKMQLINVSWIVSYTRFTPEYGIQPYLFHTKVHFTFHRFMYITLNSFFCDSVLVLRTWHDKNNATIAFKINYLFINITPKTIANVQNTVLVELHRTFRCTTKIKLSPTYISKLLSHI